MYFEDSTCSTLRSEYYIYGCSFVIQSLSNLMTASGEEFSGLCDVV